MKILDFLREQCNITLEDRGKVETRRGERQLYAGEPTEEFWKEWNAQKDKLKQAGISVRVVKYEVCAWLTPEKGEGDIPVGSKRDTSS